MWEEVEKHLQEVHELDDKVLNKEAAKHIRHILIHLDRLHRDIALYKETNG